MLCKRLERKDRSACRQSKAICVAHLPSVPKGFHRDTIRNRQMVTSKLNNILLLTKQNTGFTSQLTVDRYKGIQSAFKYSRPT